MYPPPHPSQPQISHSSVPPSQQYQSHMDHQTSSVPQIAYHSPQASTKPMTKFPQMDSSLDVHVFSQGDDPIACLNKAMDFLTAVTSSRFPSTNNQLIFNPRNQTTIQDSRVIVQQVQGRQGQSYSCTGYKGNATSFGGHNTSGQERVVKCYNCQAQEAGQILDEEQLAFLADPGIPDGQAAQKTISNNTAFQTEDLDAYDSDCDDVSNAKAVLMANISNYGSDVISEPTLYDGSVISSKHVAMPVIDDDETLILEELNKLSEDFGKCFVPQQELSAEQAFCFHMSNPFTKSSDASPVKMELPVNSLRTTPDALTEENDPLLQKIMSQDVLLSVMNSITLNGEFVNMQRSKSCDKCFNLDAQLSKTQNAYNELLKGYSQLEKHCISFELSIQLNQEIFQKDKSCDNQNALEIPEYFENNDLKAQLQDKDTTIYKLKELIKSMRENNKEEKVNHDISELETINEELENSVAKMIYENERLCKEINHVKQVFKDQFDSIKKTRVRTKEQRKEIVENAAQIPSATTIVPGMFKLYLDPLAPRLLKNREAHIDYLKHTQEQADILWGIVEQAKAKQPLDNTLDFACKHVKPIQELLVYVRDTCPNAIKLSDKKVVVTPMNKVKKVRFSEPLTSLSNIKPGRVI
ncbi:hypothetical protein Tco_0289922 [Tanacetum coccineum]